MNPRIRESKSRALAASQLPNINKAQNLLNYRLFDSSKMADKMGLEPITHSLCILLYMPLFYINIISYFFIKIN